MLLAATLVYLLLQRFAAWGLQLKGLLEAIVMRFCSFSVQMKCTPQLDSAPPVDSLGAMSIWPMQDAACSSKPLFSL